MLDSNRICLIILKLEFYSYIGNSIIYYTYCVHDFCVIVFLAKGSERHFNKGKRVISLLPFIKL
jgi:hypothetical protein